MKSRQSVVIEVDYNDINDLRSEIDNKFHYFYKILNPVNGKYYYGIHSTNDLFDGYSGSGTILKRMYDKFGKNNCIKYIEKFFDDRASLLYYEKHIVNESVISDVNCYNLIEGGIGYIRNKSIDPESRVSPTKGKIHINDGVRNKLVFPSQLDIFLSKGWTIGETNKSTKGKIVVHLKDEERFIYPEELNDYLSNGWTKGGKSRNLGAKSFAKNQIWVFKEDRQIRIEPKDLDEYLKNGWSKGLCQSTTKGYIRITNGESDRNIHPENIKELNFYLSNGWYKGSSSATNKGRIWINNKDIEKQIYKTELEQYMDEGWSRGRCIKKNVGKS